MVTQRGPDGKFKKGESGNPGGRPKSELPTITALIDAVVTAEDWMFIFDVLLKRARRGDNKAIEMLMDRRFGKAIQTNEISGKGGTAINLKIDWDNDGSNGQG